ncbi:MAG: hypothetical protein Q9157_000169 [Trypethelium eluteriae]
MTALSEDVRVAVVAKAETVQPYTVEIPVSQTCVTDVKSPLVTKDDAQVMYASSVAVVFVHDEIELDEPEGPEVDELGRDKSGQKGMPAAPFPILTRATRRVGQSFLNRVLCTVETFDNRIGILSRVIDPAFHERKHIADLEELAAAPVRAMVIDGVRGIGGGVLLPAMTVIRVVSSFTVVKYICTVEGIPDVDDSARFEDESSEEPTEIVAVLKPAVKSVTGPKAGRIRDEFYDELNVVGALIVS